MKRSVIIILTALILALSFTACTTAPGALTTPDPNGHVKITLDPNATPALNEPAGVILQDGYEYEFIRVVWTETIAGTPVKLISSAEELASVLLPQLDESMRGEAEAKYNDEFFKNNHIAMFFLSFSSGSIKPVVKSVESADGGIVITVDGQMEGDIGTCDMASYMAIVALDNTRFPAETEVTVQGNGYGTAKTGSEA